MNIFLFAPGLLVILIRRFGLLQAIVKISLCAAVQIILALPFAVVNLYSYLSGAFNLGRVFLYEWTVNWKFIPEPIFLSREWGLFLLIVTIIGWGILASYKWTPKGLLPWISSPNFYSGGGYLKPDFIIYVLFTSNFLGIVFSRSLHYQFYVWYYHTLPFLLWQTPLHNSFRIALLFIIEVIWNIYPSNSFSSLVLFTCHMILLYFLLNDKPIVGFNWNLKNPLNFLSSRTSESSNKHERKKSQKKVNAK